jgi:integrase
MATRRPKGEGSVHRRPDGKWIGRLYYVDPVTDVAKRAQASGTSKAEVSRKLRAIQARIQQGASARDDSATFGTFATRWIVSSLEASDRKRSTKTLYGGLTRTHIVDSQLGKTRMSALKPTTVERFVTQLRAKGLSPSSVRQIYTVARAIGDAAVRDGLLAKNPFAAVRRPKVPAAEATFLQPDEIAQLLTNAETSRYAPLFEFLVNTGLRRGEALALKWSDVDLDNQVIRVRGTLARIDGDLRITSPKSDRSRRTIPLSAPATIVLERVRDRTKRDRRNARQLWQDTGFVFVTAIGEPCDPRNALRALKAAARKAALPYVGLHTLRHSAASLMLSNGVPITVVSQILGHSGISITVDVYGHVAPDVSRGALDVLGAALATSRPPLSSGSANA